MQETMPETMPETIQVFYRNIGQIRGEWGSTGRS